jgi:hypothetical protein
MACDHLLTCTVRFDYGKTLARLNRFYVGKGSRKKMLNLKVKNF